jgi:hypothetical protein
MFMNTTSYNMRSKNSHQLPFLISTFFQGLYPEPIRRVEEQKDGKREGRKQRDKSEEQGER